MGVPKFFRWISARYPCINQVVHGDEVPEVDHFYLDMNGILHTCSHPDGSSSFMSEETIFQNIKSYIQFLVQLIKPQKTLFLAVDGVAPRAKMTQQRARRFQAAQEARIAKENAKVRGQELKEEPFDPCVISPGTEFMDRLHTFLEAFVRDQVNHNESWRRIDVILSGHDCPGEGEHKIREYMSYKRGLQDYRPNERHCIYGMDADLIFLGLTTHEINMCILRENVVKSRTCVADQMPFCVTYLSVLREYIDLEFRDLKDTLPFPYDLECIIDDWIFMAFLLGNDFIPHLPNLHIHAESLLVLWDTYHVVLPQLDGYLIEYGRLNVPRFNRYLEELSKFEQSWFEEREADHRWMRGKRGAQLGRQLDNLGKEPSNPPAAKVCEQVTPVQPVDVNATNHTESSDISKLAALTGLFGPASDDIFEAGFLDEAAELMEEGVIPNPILSNIGQSKTGSNSPDPYNSGPVKQRTTGLESEDDEDESDLDAEDELIYKMHRRDYYLTKLNIQIESETGENTELLLLPIVRDYVRMLQWILCYYFLKVPDWRFFYAYHYAPFARDLKLYTSQFDAHDSSTTDFQWAEFDTSSEPVLPFIQQLMILPADGAYIVPEAYRTLMTSPTSPLAPFFPETFSTDINGKIASWEAVVLIPFVDEKCLLDAMRPMDAALTDQERNRNMHKFHLFYPACQPQACGAPKKTLKQINYAFFRDHVMEDELAMKLVCHDPKRAVCPDFPSLLRLPFSTELRRIPVHVFECPSKLESMTLVVDRSTRLASFGTVKELAERILGRPTCVRWPHCTTVMPVRLMTATEIWELENFNMAPLNPISRNSSRKPPLRNRPLRDVTAGDSEATNCRDTAESELVWFKRRLEERERYLLTRCAIQLKDSNDDSGMLQDTNDGPQPVLLFSRKLDGWTIQRKQNGNSQFHFTVIPVFAESKATDGDHLRLTTPEPGSGWFRSNCRPFGGRGGRAQRQRPNVPAMHTEPAYGLCDGLTLDVLDLLLDCLPPFPSLNNPMLDWNIGMPVDLTSIFHPGQVVVSLSRGMYGNTGEVVGVRVKKGTVSVRFYPNVGGKVDTYNFRQQVKSSVPVCIMSTSVMADKLGLPPQAVARLTGTVLVRLSESDDQTTQGCRTEECDGPDNDGEDKCRAKKLQLWNIGLNLRRNKTLAQVLGWSRYCPIRSNWLFSNRTLSLLEDYYNRFSKFWNLVINDSRSAPSSGPIVANATREEMDAVVEFLEQSGCRTAPVLPYKGTYLDADHVIQLRDLIFPKTDEATSNRVFCPLDRTKWSTRSSLICTPETLFMPVNTIRSLYPSTLAIRKDAKKPNFSSTILKSFELLDRVVFCKTGQTVPLGLFGTVIGIPSDGTDLMEVMFDKEFPGAIDIRGSGPCCAIVHSSLLIKLPIKEPLVKRTGAVDKNNNTQSGVVKSISRTTAKIPAKEMSPKNRTLSEGPTNNSPYEKAVFIEPPRASKPWPVDSSVTKASASPPSQQITEKHGNDQMKAEIEELNALLFHAKINSNKPALSPHEDWEQTVPHPDNFTISNTSDNIVRNAVNTVPSPPNLPMPPASWSFRSNNESKKVTANQMKPTMSKPNCPSPSFATHGAHKVESNRSLSASGSKLDNIDKPHRPLPSFHANNRPNRYGDSGAGPSRGNFPFRTPPLMQRFPERQPSPRPRAGQQSPNSGYPSWQPPHLMSMPYATPPVRPCPPPGMCNPYVPGAPSPFAGYGPPPCMPPGPPMHVMPYSLPPGSPYCPPSAGGSVPPLQHQFYRDPYYEDYMNYRCRPHGAPLFNRGNPPPPPSGPSRYPPPQTNMRPPPTRSNGDKLGPRPNQSERIRLVPPRVVRAQKSSR